MPTLATATAARNPFVLLRGLDVGRRALQAAADSHILGTRAADIGQSRWAINAK
jgi:hypothetical protein